MRRLRGCGRGATPGQLVKIVKLAKWGVDHKSGNLGRLREAVTPPIAYRASTSPE